MLTVLSMFSISASFHLPGSRMTHNQGQEVTFRIREDQPTNQRRRPAMAADIGK
jgi:hypothetical protein